MTDPTTSRSTSWAPAAQNIRSLQLSARQLLNTAIFAAIFAVLTYALGLLSLFGPLAWLVSVPIAVIVNGITFTLFLTRVTHLGMVTLFGVVMAVVFVLHGGAAVGVPFTLVFAVLADLVALAGRYRTRWSAICSYALFSVTAFTPFIPIVLNRGSFFRTAAWEATGESYVEAAERLFILPVLGLLVLGCVAAGLVGGWFGTAVLRKHFVAAGLA